MRDDRSPVQGLKDARTCSGDVDHRDAGAAAVDLESANCTSVRIERGCSGVGKVNRQPAFVRLQHGARRLRFPRRADARIHICALAGERLNLARGFLVGHGFDVDGHRPDARVREHLRKGEFSCFFGVAEDDSWHLRELEMVQGRVWTIGRRPLRQLLRRRRKCLGGGWLRILGGGPSRLRMHRPEVVDNLPLACVNKAGDIRRQFDYAPEIDTVVDPLNRYPNRLQTPQDILNWFVKSGLVQVYSPPRVKNGKGRGGLDRGQRGSR